MKETKAKADAYQIITDRILAIMEAGTVPWAKGWDAMGGGINGRPANLVSKKPYRGANAFLLGCSGFSSNWWVSFKQAKELGGQVRKGERGTPVVFWKFLGLVDDKGKPVMDPKTGKQKEIPMLRYYTVFNVEQCDGLEGRIPPVTATPKNEVEQIESARAIVGTMPLCPKIEHKGDAAFYSPVVDVVTMPPQEQFHSGPEYYSTLFHELVHATGHTSRLNRKGVMGEDGDWTQFGTAPYAQEELVAELGAAFLCGESGILHRTIDRSAAYLAGWIKRLKEDKKLFIHAAGQAQKAADFMLSGQDAEDDKEAAE